MIKKRSDEGWTFVYLGANQDAYLESAKIGIDAGGTQSYNTAQTRKAMKGMAAATMSYTADPDKDGGFWKDQ
jgi:hypothetical protein